jgi:DNA invertase Pin-like site-specific DNA recombinase
MKTTDAASTPAAAITTSRQPLVPSKIHPEHLERLAIVYVRQSSPYQVTHHVESRERQYALVHRAAALGWPKGRVVVIDDDTGTTATTVEHRSGFQHIAAEVTMGHVGVILGIELARLSRSCKDWYTLLDVCAIFDTVLADEDAIYDANDSNDRLLLGLKGTISEFELVIMRNRLERGKLPKAQRGALFLHAPVGYMKGADGELLLDPDEQVRGVVQLIFDKFAELGSIHATFRYLREHDICLGLRPITGSDCGTVVWRRAHLGTVASILRNPTYAGTYTYGRFPMDRKRRRAGSKRAIRFAPMSEWQVILHDKFPGYITWERYLENRERMRQNRTTMTTRGSARGGGALLAGILYCEKCGLRMVCRYNQGHLPRYECHRHVLDPERKTCCALAGDTLDVLVEQEVLRAIAPAALELNLHALSHLQQERERLTRHWQKDLERVRYEVATAERRYRAVDPENRLVARTLEQQWEAALQKERSVIEDYERFQCKAPRALTTRETSLIQSLAENLPAVWNAPTTTALDKQEVIRCLIERVSVQTPDDHEHVEVAITWMGGDITKHDTRRPVMKYDQLENFAQLRDAIASWREQGVTNAEIAERLNREGFRPPTRRASQFTRPLVAQLICRLGLAAPRASRDILGRSEWWLRALAEKLQVGTCRVRGWLFKGYVNWRKLAGGQYVVWADCEELSRLKKLRDWSLHDGPYPEQLTLPKTRSKEAVTGKQKPKVRGK